MRRLGIFLFYDKDGHVSAHMKRSIEAFKLHIDEIIFVANGHLEEATLEDISSLIAAKIIRDNVGFDVWGYKAGLEYIGYEKLCAYDEIVFFNYTFFAPFHDLAHMFEAMRSRDVDYWGMTAYNDGTRDFLQSYFLVTRKRLHSNPEFHEYWQDMPMVNSVEDSLTFHEFRFSRHFRDLGFTGAPFIANESNWDGNTTLTDIRSALNKGLPIVKYRAFNFESNFLERRGGRRPKENLDFIASFGKYPIQEIWDYIISQTKPDDLIVNAELLRFTSNVRHDGQNTRSEDVVIATLSDVETIDLAMKRLEIFASDRVFVSTDKEEIAETARSAGFKVKMFRLGEHALALWLDELSSLARPDSLVFNLHDFVFERSRYFFKESLFVNYWDSLAASVAVIEQIGAWMAEMPQLGLVFSPPDSVEGRESRTKGLQSSASNWNFDSYPDFARSALGQALWPWNGVCVLKGVLFSSPTFCDRIRFLSESVKPGSAEVFAGVEALLPEIVRRERFASGLVVAETQAAKLMMRSILVENQTRKNMQELSNKFRSEIRSLRIESLQKRLRPGKRLEVGTAGFGSSASEAAFNLILESGERYRLSLGPFAGMIDDVVEDGELLKVRGWSFDHEDPSSELLIAIESDCVMLGDLIAFNEARQDVADAFPDKVLPGKCGFNLYFPSPALAGLSGDDMHVIIINPVKMRIWTRVLASGSLMP